VSERTDAKTTMTIEQTKQQGEIEI